eukprot:6194667-Pleurochrysis_carterae.AAC.3
MPARALWHLYALGARRSGARRGGARLWSPSCGGAMAGRHRSRAVAPRVQARRRRASPTLSMCCAHDSRPSCARCRGTRATLRRAAVKLFSPITLLSSHLRGESRHCRRRSSRCVERKIPRDRTKRLESTAGDGWRIVQANLPHGIGRDQSAFRHSTVVRVRNVHQGVFR